MRRTGTPVAGRRSAGNETMTAVSPICFARTPLGCDMLPHPPYPTKPCSPKRAAIPQSIVSSLRDVRFVVCHFVLPGFRPCGTWAMYDVRFAMYDLRCTIYEVRGARLEIFLKQSRRDKIPVTPHKRRRSAVWGAKPQCGAKTHKRRRSAVWGAKTQCGAKTHKRRRSAVWSREEVTPHIANRKSQIANRPRKKRPPFREALGIHRINVLLIFNTSQRSAVGFRSI